MCVVGVGADFPKLNMMDLREKKERERERKRRKNGGGRSAAALLLLAFWHSTLSLSLSLSPSQPRSFVCFDRIGGGGRAGDIPPKLFDRRRPLNGVRNSECLDVY